MWQAFISQQRRENTYFHLLINEAPSYVPINVNHPLAMISEDIERMPTLYTRSVLAL